MPGADIMENHRQVKSHLHMESFTSDQSQTTQRKIEQKQTERERERESANAAHVAKVDWSPANCFYLRLQLLLSIHLILPISVCCVLLMQVVQIYSINQQCNFCLSEV